MIVTIAGWLYIINAALVLSSLKAPGFGVGLSGQAGTVLLGAGMGAIGFGLLQRKTWGRWFALGPSFLGWTVGALLALGMLVLLGFFLVNAGNLGAFGAFIGFLLVFTTLLSVVGVVINFKLYWHLVSHEGKQEFGAPESDSFVTVLQSAGVWVVAVVISIMMSAGGSLLGAAALGAMFGDSRAEQQAQRRDMEQRAARESAERELRQYRAQQERLAQQRQQDEAASRALLDAPAVGDAPPVAAPNYSDALPIGAEAPPAETEAPVPDQDEYAQPGEKKQPDSKRILKCRDASGGLQFTQGYCPPGTQEVAQPAFQ